MNINAINLRIKKNKFPECAGENYCDMHSLLVKTMRDSGKLAYLGISNQKGEYTVIGENSMYIRTTRRECEVPFDIFVQALSTAARQNGKSQNLEYVPLDNCGDVWIKDSFTMSALWNTVLLFISNKLSKTVTPTPKRNTKP